MNRYEDERFNLYQVSFRDLVTRRFVAVAASPEAAVEIVRDTFGIAATVRMLVASLDIEGVECVSPGVQEVD